MASTPIGPIVKLPFTNEPAFWDAMRTGIMGPKLETFEVIGTTQILGAMNGLPISWVACSLATSWHETAHTMAPIKEMGGNAYLTRMYDITGQRPALARKMGNTTPGDGLKYPGRGYVQLTWKTNYERATTKLRALGILKGNESLVDNPELAMRPDYAAAILRWGMVEGWFTGKKFSSYLSSDPNARGSRTGFVNSRYIINGQDKAALIADYALKFQDGLVKGGWFV